MENAAKALLIAAGVLVGIIMLSIGVALFAMFSKQAKSYDKIISENEIQKFNSNFIVYLGETDILAQDVVSAVNKAKEYSGQITVEVYKKNGITRIDTTDPETFNSETFLKDYKDITFECSGNDASYNAKGKIIKIKFTAKKDV